ncbi:dienelactone hydrolase [Limtongia smithiae]|uniref:dienelactone hydrolase n=1 Tax=Limtongia smithiae TaxID=1125753 RepID=UPI0034CFD8A8
MTSLAPGACCMEGYEHAGTATGTTVSYKGIDIYVAEPTTPTDKCIIYITDIFGFPFGNHKILSDNFAKFGFLTVIPNLFYDDAVPYPRPDGFDLPAWVKKHGIDATEPLINKAFDYVKEKYPAVTKFFAVGYCFGGKYVVRYLDGRLNAGFIAHPSFVMADELKAMKGPLSIAAAETDSIFPEEKRHESEVILKEMKATYQINLYSSVDHGFAVRGDLGDEVGAWTHEAAFYQAVNWFNRFAK